MSLVTKGNPFKEDNLANLVTKGLTTREKVTRTGGRLYAGDAGYCARKAVAMGKPGMEGTGSASGKFYMGIGSAIGELIADGLYGAGVLCYKEYKIPDVGLNLGGYIDVIAVLESKIWVVENKSCGELPAKPKEEHLPQAQTYSLVTGLPAKLLYMSRSVAEWDGKLKIKTFEVPTDEDSLRKVATSIATAYHYSQAGFLPDIPVGFTGKKNCSYCPFIKSCWEEVPPPFPRADKEMREILDEKIKASVEELIENRPHRRNQVLKHLSYTGNPAAVKLLKGTDWSTL